MPNHRRQLGTVSSLLNQCIVRAETLALDLSGAFTFTVQFMWIVFLPLTSVSHI